MPGLPPGPHVRCRCGYVRDQQGLCPHCDRLVKPWGRHTGACRGPHCTNCVNIKKYCHMCGAYCGSVESAELHADACRAREARATRTRRNGG